jgi:hypothetical protein
MNHLWEVGDHPYYGADGYFDEFESFVELREAAEHLDEDMNHIYRWDWEDDSQPHRADLFLDDDEDRTGQRLKVFFVLPRKSTFLNWQCPVTYEDEPAVLEWLRGPRVLGALRRMWAPILDTAEVRHAP